MHTIHQQKSHRNHQTKCLANMGVIGLLLTAFSIAALADTTTTGSTIKNVSAASTTKGAKSTAAKLPSFKAPLSTINNPNPVNAQELPPDTIQTIQLIGRSVLAAKHSEVLDPNAAQVKARLQTLRQNLDEVIKAEQAPSSSALVLSSASTSNASSNNASSNKIINKKTAQQSLAEHDVEQRKHQQDVDQKTSALKQDLSEIKADNQQRRQNLSNQEENEHQPHVRQLLDKSQSISDEIDTALADKSPERMAKLMQLRDRLTVKTLDEMQPAKTTAEETPTISTITRHRE